MNKNWQKFYCVMECTEFGNHYKKNVINEGDWVMIDCNILSLNCGLDIRHIPCDYGGFVEIKDKGIFQFSDSNIEEDFFISEEDYNKTHVCCATCGNTDGLQVKCNSWYYIDSVGEIYGECDGNNHEANQHWCSKCGYIDGPPITLEEWYKSALFISLNRDNKINEILK